MFIIKTVLQNLKQGFLLVCVCVHVHVCACVCVCVYVCLFLTCEDCECGEGSMSHSLPASSVCLLVFWVEITLGSPIPLLERYSLLIFLQHLAELINIINTHTHTHTHMHMHTHTH